MRASRELDSDGRGCPDARRRWVDRESPRPAQRRRSRAVRGAQSPVPRRPRLLSTESAAGGHDRFVPRRPRAHSCSRRSSGTQRALSSSMAAKFPSGGRRDSRLLGRDGESRWDRDLGAAVEGACAASLRCGRCSSSGRATSARASRSGWRSTPSTGCAPSGSSTAIRIRSPRPSGRLPPFLGGPTDARCGARAHRRRHVMLAFSPLSDGGLDGPRPSVPGLGVEVSRRAALLRDDQPARGRRARRRPAARAAARARTATSWRFTIKHAMDRVVAGMRSRHASPLLLAIARRRRLSHPGPSSSASARRPRRPGLRPPEVPHHARLEREEPRASRRERAARPGGVEGDDRRTRDRALPAPHVARRAAAAHQRRCGGR